MNNQRKIVFVADGSTTQKPHPTKPNTRYLEVAINANEQAFRKSQTCNKHSNYYAAIGDFKKSSHWRGLADYWFERSQEIRPLVRLRDAELRVLAYQQSLLDIDVLIAHTKESQVNLLLSQKHIIHKHIAEYEDYIVKMKQGLSTQKINDMQQRAKQLLIDVKR